MDSLDREGVESGLILQIVVHIQAYRIKKDEKYR